MDGHSINRGDFRVQLHDMMEELASEPVRNEAAVLSLFKGYDAVVERLGKVGETHVRLVESSLTGGKAVVIAEFLGSEPVMEQVEVDGEMVTRQRKAGGREMARSNWSLLGRKRFVDAEQARGWARQFVECWKSVEHESEVGFGEAELEAEDWSDI